MNDEKRYGPSCRHCGNHLCDCRASADDTIRELRAQLAERTRERDYALERCAHWSDTYHREKADWVDERSALAEERDAARAEVGRLVEQLAEVTGRLTLAEIEVGRLREALGEIAGPPSRIAEWMRARARQALAKAGDG